MINKIIGDSIVLSNFFRTDDGTYLTEGAATMYVYDSIGSRVFSGPVGTLAGTLWGTTQLTTGWAFGPITETWSLTDGDISTTKQRVSAFRIVPVDFIESYVDLSDLRSYYENIDDYLDNESEEQMGDSYRYINSRLQSMGYKLPVGTSPDTGIYDQSLRDWNAYDTIYRVVSRRAASRGGFDERQKPWYEWFKDKSDGYWQDYKNHKVVLHSQTSVAEAGIGRPTKTAGTGMAMMETNWEGYGDGFRGADFQRTWQVKTIGGGATGTFTWSMDDGASIGGTIYGTSSSWIALDQEVYVRFFFGSNAGTTRVYDTSDAWSFQTAPVKFSAGGKNSVKSYQ